MENTPKWTFLILPLPWRLKQGTMNSDYHSSWTQTIELLLRMVSQTAIVNSNLQTYKFMLVDLSETNAEITKHSERR